MIEFTRGDSKRLKFQVLYCDEEPIKHKATEMKFTCREEPKSTSPILIEKVLDTDITFDTTDYYYRFTIAPNDTKDLDYGTYGCDIQVKINGLTKTIYTGKIHLTDEYTY